MCLSINPFSRADSEGVCGVQSKYPLTEHFLFIGNFG